MIKYLTLGIATIFSCLTVSAQSNDLAALLMKAVERSFVVLQQEYQLVDNETDEVLNAQDRDYWARTFSLVPRVGDDSFLIPVDGVRPWSHDDAMKGDKYSGVITITKIRNLSDTEFETLDYESEEVSEVSENRLFVVPGSDERGMTVKGASGQTNGFLILALATTLEGESDSSPKIKMQAVRKPLRFAEGKSVYDLDLQDESSIQGGIYVTPLYIRPGLVDFCLSGMLQKIGGRWKLVSVPVDYEIISSESEINSTSPHFITGLLDEMGDSMNEFIGL